MVGGYEYHDEFKPRGCNITVNTTAVTAGAGSYVSDIYHNLDKQNQTAVDGLGPEVTLVVTLPAAAIVLFRTSTVSALIRFTRWRW